MWRVWRSHRWLRFGVRFLVVWLASGLVAWLILQFFAQAELDLHLLAHAFLASILIGAWRQPPTARDPEWRAIGKGAVAAVLVIWCDIASISIYILARPESFQPGRLSGAVALLAPLFLGSLLALIVGAAGGCFGVLLAYNLRRSRRRGEQAGAP